MMKPRIRLTTFPTQSVCSHLLHMEPVLLVDFETFCLPESDLSPLTCHPWAYQMAPFRWLVPNGLPVAWRRWSHDTRHTRVSDLVVNTPQHLIRLSQGCTCFSSLHLLFFCPPPFFFFNERPRGRRRLRGKEENHSQVLLCLLFFYFNAHTWCVKAGFVQLRRKVHMRTLHNSHTHTHFHGKPQENRLVSPYAVSEWPVSSLPKVEKRLLFQRRIGEKKKTRHAHPTQSRTQVHSDLRIYDNV